GELCGCWFTATTDSVPIARTFAAFSNSVSGCATFGPSGPGNPDLDEEVMDGMIPDVILIHAPRDDKPADQLSMNLGNEIQVRRSYHLLSKKFPHYALLPAQQGKEHVVWFQFGTNVKWNS